MGTHLGGYSKTPAHYVPAFYLVVRTTQGAVVFKKIITELTTYEIPM